MNHDLDNQLAELLNPAPYSSQHLRTLFCILSAHKALHCQNTPRIFEKKDHIELISEVMGALDRCDLLRPDNIETIFSCIIQCNPILENIILLFATHLYFIGHHSEHSRAPHRRRVLS